MTKRPLFSCVIPVKGVRPYFDAALKSLQTQGLGDDLEIIVQDGDKELDNGQSDALNKGFAKAHGKWLFWLNADDLLLPGALKAVAALIRAKPNARWITGNEVFIDANGRVVSCAVGAVWRGCLSRHTVPHVYGPSSFFCRELFAKVGGCDISLKYCMDWDLWIKFAKFGASFERIPSYLWAQRRWAGSKTQRPLAAAESVRQWAEIEGMLSTNDFHLTRSGVFLGQFWLLLTGCYLKEWVDGWRLKGRRIDEL